MDETLKPILEQAARENWSREQLAEAVWQAAVEWAGSLVVEWRAPETAPKDGSRFLSRYGDRVCIMHRHDPGGAARNPQHNYECWVGDNGPRFSGGEFDAWLPLPPLTPLEPKYIVNPAYAAVDDVKFNVTEPMCE